MTRHMRAGLGMLCVAAICVIVGIAASQEEGNALGGIGIGSGGLIATIGLLVLAVELFRKHPGD